MAEKIKILDCTLRDGGYYNNWNFKNSLVKKYITAMSEAKIDVVEIGFRFLSQEKSLGSFAYSADEYIKTLPLPSSLDIAVMINAKEIIESELGVKAAIELLFSKKSESPLDIVRIATHVDDILQCQYIANILQTLGYRVFLNLMQIDSIDISILSNIVKQVQNWNCIEVFYFADSFGNMNSTSISEVVKAINTEWSGDIGLHAHDNKGHALVNSMHAIDCGVSYIDATIMGMGRGAGNTKMETLLVEAIDRDLGEYFPDALFPLVLQDFEQLQKEYNWGSSIYYYLSAVHGIHPTYIQEMLGDGRYDINQILSAINFLKSASSSSYSFESMLEAISKSSGNHHGNWSANDWAKGRDILIVGSGPSTKQYISDIVKYIKNKNPVVLCLNINKDIPEELVTAYVACHETRITIELDLYSSLTKPIILPMGRIPVEIKGILSNVDILDYGLRIEESGLKISNNGCTLDKPLVLVYALSLSSISGVNKILLTGIDGYEVNNPKQQEMVRALNRFKENNTNIEIHAITPTTYPIEQSLIYDSSI